MKNKKLFNNFEKQPVVKMIIFIAAIATIFSLLWQIFHPDNQNNSIIQDNSPGAIATINNQGNITINSALGIPEPRINFTDVEMDVPEKGIYRSEILLSINTSAPIPEFYLAIKSDSILKMEVEQKREGIFVTGSDGKDQEGFYYTHIINAYGNYKVLVYTKNKGDIFDFHYDY